MLDFSLPFNDLLGGFLGFFFTIAILSYVFGDNPLFRFALHVFIGVSAGYITLVIINDVIQPRFVDVISGGRTALSAFIIIPLVITLFLVMKLNTRTSSLGNIGVAYLLGVGVGTAIGGTITGTLFPQIQATWLSIFPNAGLEALSNLIMVIGTVTSLLFFQIWIRPNKRSLVEGERQGIMRLLTFTGKGFISLSLGAVYGGLIISGIAIFADRIVFLSDFFKQLFGM